MKSITQMGGRGSMNDAERDSESEPDSELEEHDSSV